MNYMGVLVTTLVVWCAGVVSAHAPVAPPPDDSECALLLTGPGRSSAYDYTINLLKGNFGYDGQQSCITYEAVNQAYLEARQRILVAQPKGDWKPEDYASVGELVLDISINLARRYGLTYEEIEKGLPLIDTSRTLIREVCPPVFSHVECRAGKYRRLDGLCNNLRHPTWGAINAPFQRLLSPLFADGMNAPRVAHSGRALPPSRVVSRTMHPDEGFHDHAGTVMVIAWGQFMDHDYTLTGTPLDPVNRNDPEECCKRPQHLKHPYCNEIRIPDDDYFYRLFGVKCIDFVRGFPSPRPGCRLGSRVPFNTLTGVIDGNTVYGVTEKFARKLRTGYGGLLRMNPVFQEYGLKDLLPLKLDIPDEGCTRPNKNMYCFEAGEIRVNEQLVLTVMHTLMAREHNRVAHGLAAVNPHWDDETLYQEARRINIAEIQHITYNEFLPILLGKDVMEKFGLVLEKEGYWDGYDPEVNPDVLASFAAAAYRFGHSLLPTAVERWSKAHKFIASKRLSDLIRRPYDLYRAGVLDEYVMGLMNQVAQAMDDSITQEVTNHLFKKVGARFGMDLVSFNMQRGREFGLPGYMEFRKFCGLPGADSFDDLHGSMPNSTVRKYESIFEHPVDVDLWSGGVSERPLPGSMLGPTFACIIATQFSYSRRGDRFWYELPHQPSSFTPEQLAEVRKARLARVICDNTDIIDTVQLYPMVLPDHELNPRVACRSGIIPSMDFSKWAEPAPAHLPHAVPHVTEAIASNVNYIMNATDEINLNNVTTYDKHIPNNRNATTTDKMASNTNNKNQTILLEEDKHSNDTTNTPHEEVIKVHKNGDKDVLHKYVSGKDAEASPKRGGHYKNMLRKRRSVTTHEPAPAAVIVNYDTLHPPHTVNNYTVGNTGGGGGGGGWFPARNTDARVNNAQLAHFDIETLHDNTNNDKSSDIELKKNHSSQRNDEISSEENEETKERKPATDDHIEKPNIENSSSDARSEERGSYENEKPKNSQEANKYESDENSSSSIEIDRENNEKHSNKQEYQEKDTFRDKPIVVQDIDLGDFSYEKIQLNKEGKVVPVQDNLDNRDNDMSTENHKTEKPQRNNRYKELDTQSEEVDSSSIESSEKREPTPINDGEVKPVVEINAEVDNSGSSEEHSNDSLEDNNKSLETVNKDDSGISRKLQDFASYQNDKDVKQQFERIPLNYTHQQSINTNAKDADTSTPFQKYDEHLNVKFDDIQIKLPEIKLPDDILGYTESDYLGLHKDKKKNNEKERFYHYDDELKDDDDSDETDTSDDDDATNKNKHKENEKNKNPRYSPYREKGEKDGHKHYGYYKESPYKETSHPDNHDYNDDEDPYERFVRERFGKRDNFKKRSEKLQQYRENNPALYTQVENILKKTKKVNEEVAKSGDPNAGYMWTLEYGEKL